VVLVVAVDITLDNLLDRLLHLQMEYHQQFKDFLVEPELLVIQASQMAVAVAVLAELVLILDIPIIRADLVV
jgi:hypothetical protein|tara:strand:+ start:83 stop:298 length:216 start_codon:yes stop_codon:yes gene_type:complete